MAKWDTPHFIRRVKLCLHAKIVALLFFLAIVVILNI